VKHTTLLRSHSQTCELIPTFQILCNGYYLTRYVVSALYVNFFDILNCVILFAFTIPWSCLLAVSHFQQLLQDDGMSGS